MPAIHTMCSPCVGDMAARTYEHGHAGLVEEEVLADLEAPDGKQREHQQKHEQLRCVVSCITHASSSHLSGMFDSVKHFIIIIINLQSERVALVLGHGLDLRG